MSKLVKQSKNVATWLLAGTMLVGNVYANEVVMDAAGQENINAVVEQAQETEQVKETNQTQEDEEVREDQEAGQAQQTAQSQEDQQPQETEQVQPVQEVEPQVVEENAQESVEACEEVAVEEVQEEELIAQDNLADNEQIFMGVQVEDSLDNVNAINTYSLEVEDPAKVRFFFDIDEEIAFTLTIQDEQGNKAFSTNVITEGSAWKNIYPYLNKGKYTVKITSYANKTGSYKLKVSYEKKFDLNETSQTHDTNETAQEVILGDTIKGAFLSNRKKSVYKFTTTKPVTCLDFEYKKGAYTWSEYDNSYKRTIYNEQGDEVGNKMGFVPAGTYYLVLEDVSSDEGQEYSIKFTYNDEYDLTESEPNNSYEMANEIKLDGTKYSGASTFKDDKDYYTFTVTEKDNVIITTKKSGSTNYSQDCYYEIIDEYGKQKYRSNFWGKDSEYTKSVTLAPGKYYLIMNSTGTCQGTYEMSLVSAKEKEFLEQQTKLNNFVKRLYEKCFKREADESGLNYWVGRLQKGEANGAELGKFFVNSKEILDAQLNDTEYLNILYGAFFNRDADDAGRDYWISKMNNGNTRYSVLASFINSSEYADICKGYGIDVGVMELGHASEMYPNMTEFVYKFYQKCMGRAASQDELDFWVGELVKGNYTGRSLAKYFVFSDEFQNKKLDNDHYIEEMYQVFFERASDIPGKAYWLEQMNSGANKEVVFDGFVQSDEFKYSCKVAGVTY